MSLGFEKQGFSVEAAFDWWDPSIAVYKQNFNHPIFKQDLSDEKTAISAIKKFRPEIIIGGPPCQDFSSAGKRDLKGGRADLTYHFANIICAIKPKFFLMENVEQIKRSYIINDVVKQFKDHGYGLTAFILDASLCGVPQARTRFFLFGQKGASHNALMPIVIKNISNKQMTVKDYLGDSLGIDYYYRHPRNYNRRGIFSINEPSPTIRGVNRPIPKGYKINSCDPKGVSLKKIRPLTTIERSYIQTFPKTFKFSGPKTHLEQMIGNAVPVKLAEFVAKCIKDLVADNKVKSVTSTFVLPQRVIRLNKESQINLQIELF